LAAGTSGGGLIEDDAIAGALNIIDHTCLPRQKTEIIGFGRLLKFATSQIGPMEMSSSIV
jgi:hypothetical protein